MVEGLLQRQPGDIEPAQNWLNKKSPNKPRLELEPIEEAKAALAAFFNDLFASDRPELRRVYGRACLPLATFGKPEETFPTMPRKKSYETMRYASEDFRQIRGNNVVALARPELEVVPYDGNLIIAARYWSPRLSWRFPQVRERFVDDATFSIEQQAMGEPTHVQVDKEHRPDVIFPIARTYRADQAHKVVKGLKPMFEDLFPEELTLQPQLTPPSMEAADASFPSPPNPSPGMRRSRISGRAHKGETLGHWPMVDFSITYEEDYPTLFERGLIHARTHPRSEVTWFGIRGDDQTIEPLNFISICNAPTETLVIK